jgi:hypothetical protein
MRRIEWSNSPVVLAGALLEDLRQLRVQPLDYLHLRLRLPEHICASREEGKQFRSNKQD